METIMQVSVRWDKVQVTSARPNEALSVQDAELLIARIRAAIDEINKSNPIMSGPAVAERED
jgi:hypothetical protein